MNNTAFDWQIDEFMVYCRSKRLREKTIASNFDVVYLLKEGGLVKLV